MWMFALAVVAFVVFQVVREDLAAGYELVPAEIM
jgi:hypothetical protein